MVADPDLFEHLSSVRELWAAARRAARGKRGRPSVAQALFHLEGLVLHLHDRLRDGSWRPGKPTQHVVHDGKRRVISAAPFADRVVHQALCATIGPLLDRHLIDHTYACRVGRGTHAALRQARLWTGHYRYALLLDAQKFFPSVDHAILLAQLERDLRCPRTLEVCRLILAEGARVVSPARFHFPGDTLFAPHDRAIGLPIGSLTSQHFANRFLSPVDHRAKDRLRIRPYLRYMDNMLLFSDDRQQLIDWGHELEAACWRQRLRLHPWQVQPTSGGIGWLGFRLFPGLVRVKAVPVRRAIRRLRELVRQARRDPARWPLAIASLQATLAHWRHADTWRLRTGLLRDLDLYHDPIGEEDPPEKEE
jgi:hypothetical protein